MSRERPLVIDADLGRLARQLKYRGRNAIGAAELHLADNVKDPELLRGLAAHFGTEPWVLVTGDDRMPAEHGPVVHETAATLATIGAVPPGLLEYPWRVDVVHRWAHAMQQQAPGSVRRYTDKASTIWRPRRRHLLLARQQGWTPAWTPPTDA